jgi:hypothetical protein
MPDIHDSLSDREMALVEQAAADAGMSVEDFYTHAALTELRSRICLPRTEATVIPFKSPRINNDHGK